MRPIDADALTADLIQSYSPNADVYLVVRKILDDAPTVDVVPIKMVEDLEYENRLLYNEGQAWRTKAKDLEMRLECMRSYKKRLAKVFEELEAEITAAFESNYKAKAIDTADDFVAYCEGRIHALRGLLDFIEELKKKYTEGDNGTN